MSKADEMFDELDYTKQEYANTICYINKCDEEISIDKDARFVIKQCYFSELNFYEAREITMQELQAINEKCKELGWEE